MSLLTFFTTTPLDPYAEEHLRESHRQRVRGGNRVHLNKPAKITVDSMTEVDLLEGLIYGQQECLRQGDTVTKIILNLKSSFLSKR